MTLLLYIEMFFTVRCMLFDAYRYHFNKCKSDAHLPESFTFHCLRHTYAVNFLRAGGDLLDLKYRLGHSSLASTSRYLHFSRNMMKNQVSYIDTLLKGGALNAD
jgi:integrase/recombinase XerD